jgi:hypothetical protein
MNNLRADKIHKIGLVQENYVKSNSQMKSNVWQKCYILQPYLSEVQVWVDINRSSIPFLSFQNRNGKRSNRCLSGDKYMTGINIQTAGF